MNNMYIPHAQALRLGHGFSDSQAAIQQLQFLVSSLAQRLVTLCDSQSGIRLWNGWYGANGNEGIVKLYCQLRTWHDLAAVAEHFTEAR